MMSHKIELDHIVVVAASLEDGVKHVNDQLGIEIPKGGKHPFMGTHNHVMQLGPSTFLEVIAIDPNGGNPKHPRWFDLDNFGDQEPKLKMWVARSQNIWATTAYMPEKNRRIIPMSRPTENGIMKWDISVAEDGSLPYDGAFPTVLQWPEGQLPIERMPDLGCGLLKFEIAHPESKKIEAQLRPIFEDMRVEFVWAEQPRLTAQIDTPKGPKTLS